MDFDEFVKSKNGKYIIGGAVLLLLLSGGGEEPAGVQPLGQQPAEQQPYTGTGYDPGYNPGYQAPPVTPGYDGQREIEEVRQEQERQLERQRQRWHDVITEEERVRDPETGETRNIPYEDYDPNGGSEQARPEDYERPPDHLY